jgi:hypothetical protein
LSITLPIVEGTEDVPVQLIDTVGAVTDTVHVTDAGR